MKYNYKEICIKRIKELKDELSMSRDNANRVKINEEIGKTCSIIKTGQYSPDIISGECICGLNIIMPAIVVTWRCPVCKTLMRGVQE